MGTWIDFKQLREQLDFGELLGRYGVQLKANSAGQHHGRCPLPGHPRDSTSLSFSASLKKKIWRCFGCNRSGNVLDFAVYMEGLNPKVAGDVRKVAVMLQERRCVRSPPNSPTAKAGTNTPARQQQAPKADPRAPKMREVMNAPLDFALKNLSMDHPFFHKRDLSPETVRHFGLGFCTKGIFAGRIAVPLHDLEGNLVGHFGVLTDEFDVTDQTPQYLWPEPREHAGVRHVLDRSQLLYHGHMIVAPAKELIIVQSAESAWRVHQCGYPHVISILGEVPSINQSEMVLNLVSPDGRIHFVTDNSKVGDRCAAELFYDLGQYRWCRWIKLEEASTPATASVEELRASLAPPTLHRGRA